MENENIRKIDLYRAQGYGYRRIAALLDMQTETVKKYCQRHPFIRKEKADENHCTQCGKPIMQTAHRKAKRFCSDKCRMAWWNTHTEKLNRKTLHTHICKHCGEAFSVYGTAARKFCSRACYAAYRRKGN